MHGEKALNAALAEWIQGKKSYLDDQVNGTSGHLRGQKIVQIVVQEGQLQQE
jgi:hypothetical protein